MLLYHGIVIAATCFFSSYGKHTYIESSRLYTPSHTQKLVTYAHYTLSSLHDIIHTILALERLFASGKTMQENFFKKTLNHMEHFARSRAMVKWKGRKRVKSEVIRMTDKKKQPIPKGFILVDLVDRGNIVEIPLTSNKAWLTLFYALPEELVSKAKAYFADFVKKRKSALTPPLGTAARCGRWCTPPAKSAPRWAPPCTPPESSIPISPAGPPGCGGRRCGTAQCSPAPPGT